MRGPSNSLLFFKKTEGARLQVFKTTGGVCGPAPMDGTPMPVHVPLVGIAPWGFLDPNIWGAKQGRTQNVGSRGEHQIKFHTWIPLTYCTAMASPKFQFWGNIQQNVLIKDFWKISKNLHKNLKKILQNFSKIKFKKI